MKKRKNKKKVKNKNVTKKSIVFSLLTWVCINISVFTICFPFWERTYSDIEQVDTITSYMNEVDSYSDSTIQEKREKAIEYNQKIYEEQKIMPFKYSSTGESDAEYQSILEGEMALVEVPKYNIFLPVMHGTSNDVLNNNAGHVYGSSVPIGGENTLSVIAAHDGLTSAKLFTDVTKMEVGDVFYIHVLDEIREYKVMSEDDILTVLPTEESQYLQIKEGKDQVALYTCYPYGINTHRRIVIGTFVQLVDTSENETATAEIKKTDKTPDYLKLAGLTIIPIFTFTAGCTSVLLLIRRYKAIQNALNQYLEL